MRLFLTVAGYIAFIATAILALCYWPSSVNAEKPTCVQTQNGTQVEDYYRDSIHYLIFTNSNGDVFVVNYTTDSLEHAFMTPDQ